MKQPEYTLKNGTRIVTHDALEGTAGIFVNPVHLGARRHGSTGTIAGVVAGHGGDVYWVKHDGYDDLGVYSFTEFELAADYDEKSLKHIFGISEENMTRAATFCQNHRAADFSFSEVLSDLAVEFERIERDARARVLRHVIEKCKALE
jgi:hypothetical protein